VANNVPHLDHKLTIAACAALSSVLGTIHAFSVFMPQWEQLPGADRASVSLIYSLALVSLTCAVLLGHRIYQRIPAFAMVGLVGVLAALGLALSASSSSLTSLYVTYGLLFGGANGLGYGFVLQLSGQAATSHRGLAMGLVTAFYGAGATVAPLTFVYLIDRGGNALALSAMSTTILIVALICATLLYMTNARYNGEPSGKRVLSPQLKNTRAMLWIGYGCGVTAGLMVIGHTYSIAFWLSADRNLAAWAATIVAFGNMSGGFSAGYFADRFSSQSLLRWLPLFTALGLFLLVFSSGTAGNKVLIALALISVGYCYGAIIAVFPVVVSDTFGTVAAPRIYGQIFTAWGLAGLLGPWSSGRLFDLTGSYLLAIVMAVIFSGISVIALRRCLPKSFDMTR